MTPKRFEKLVEARLTHCRKLLCDKGVEYSRKGDRLHNFKKAGQRRGITPERALDGMDLKHDTSIADIIEDIETGGNLPSPGALAEKISDRINYLLLLEGLITERIEAAVAQ